jgi:hypothetical protein
VKSSIDELSITFEAKLTKRISEKLTIVYEQSTVDASPEYKLSNPKSHGSSGKRTAGAM